MIGKSIGQKNTKHAMQYYKMGQVSMCFLSFLQIAVLFCFRDQIIAAFTSNSDIGAAMKAAWPFLLVFTLFDAT